MRKVAADHGVGQVGDSVAVVHEDGREVALDVTAGLAKVVLEGAFDGASRHAHDRNENLPLARRPSGIGDVADQAAPQPMDARSPLLEVAANEVHVFVFRAVVGHEERASPVATAHDVVLDEPDVLPGRDSKVESVGDDDHHALARIVADGVQAVDGAACMLCDWNDVAGILVDDILGNGGVGDVPQEVNGLATDVVDHTAVLRPEGLAVGVGANDHRGRLEGH